MKGRERRICVPWVDKGQDDPWGGVAGLRKEGRMKGRSSWEGREGRGEGGREVREGER